MDNKPLYGKSPIEKAKKHIARKKILEEVRFHIKSITDHGREIVRNATLTKEDMEFINQSKSKYND